MSNQEKLIQILVRKSKEIENVDIPAQLLEKGTPESILEAYGDIFYYNNVFYRQKEKNSNKWLYFDCRGQKTEEITEISIEEKPIESRIKTLENWTWQFKKHIDEKLQEIKELQDESLKVMKEYIDAQIKLSNKEL